MRLLAMVAVLSAAGLAVVLARSVGSPDFSFDDSHWWGVGAA